ncbi:hypothetical protein LINPERHAP1_LOCUS10134, partial [Linum perenne]
MGGHVCQLVNRLHLQYQTTHFVQISLIRFIDINLKHIFKNPLSRLDHGIRTSEFEQKI